MSTWLGARTGITSACRLRVSQLRYSEYRVNQSCDRPILVLAAICVCVNAHIFVAAQTHFHPLILSLLHPRRPPDAVLSVGHTLGENMPYLPLDVNSGVSKGLNMTVCLTVLIFLPVR